MGVRRRGRNSWEITVELGHDPVNGRRRRLTQTVKGTRRDAEVIRAHLLHRITTGIDLEPTRLTVAAYLERWLEAVRPNLAPTTRRGYEGLLRHQVIPYIGGIPISKLRPLHVQQLYARLREEGRADGRGGLNPRTLLHVHRVLSEALQQAVRWQIVARNVCQAVEAPQPRRAEIRALSPEEARRLLEVAGAADDTSGDAVILALHTGLRLGELLALHWEDVDLERGTVSVRRTLENVSGNTFREPKTARGRRVVPVGPTVVERLRRRRRLQQEKCLTAGSSWQDQRLVFTSADGGILSGFALRRAFYRLLSQARLPRVRFHDLRHTHASLLLARGVHPKVVSERLGHATIGITLDTYSHVMPTVQEQAARDLDAWLSGQG
jgi:integrase